MPTPNRDYPNTPEDWKDALPSGHFDWLLHIANENLWNVDDSAYEYLVSLGKHIQSGKFVWAENVETGSVTVDEFIIDVRKFALQKAREVIEFQYEDDEADALVQGAKIIEAYLLGK